MGWLEGLLSGYTDQHLEVEKENVRKAENAAKEEGEIYKLMLNSPDPVIKAKAASGILQLGQPQSRKGGFRGWLGQMETTPAYPELLEYATTKHWFQDPADPTPRPPEGAQQQIATPPAATGSAAMPTTPAQTEPGAPPMAKVSLAPGAPGAAARTGPPGVPSANVRPPSFGASAGAPPAAPDAGVPPPPPPPGVSAAGLFSRPPATPPASLAPPPPPPQRTTFDPKPATKDVYRLPHVFATAADLAGQKEEAEVSGTIRGWQEMFKADGDPEWQRKGIEAAMAQKRGAGGGMPYVPQRLEYEDENGKTIQIMGFADKVTGRYSDSQGMPILGQNIRPVRPTIDFGDNNEAAASILFGGKRFADLTDPRQRALAVQYGNVMAQQKAYSTATGTNNAAFEKQLDAMASQATQLPVGSRSSDLVPGYTPNPAPAGGQTAEEIAAAAAAIPEAPAGETMTRVPAPGATPNATPAPTTQPTPQPTPQAGAQPQARPVPQQGATVVPRVATDFQVNSAKYYGRAQDALRRLEEATDPADPDFGSLEDRIAEQGLFGQMQSKLPWDLLKNDDQQQYQAAQRAFTEARLRQESGAAVPPHEYVNDAQTYFAQPGNSPETIEMKREMRKQVLDGMAFAAGPAYQQRYGSAYTPIGRQPGQQDSPHFRLGAEPPLNPDGSIRLTISALPKDVYGHPEGVPTAPVVAPKTGPPPAPPGRDPLQLQPQPQAQPQQQSVAPPQPPGTITLDTELKKLRSVNGKLIKVE